VLALVSQSSTTVSSRSTLSFTRPSNAAGQTEVIWIEVDAGAVTASGTETGWELVGTGASHASTRLAVYARRQLAGDAATTQAFTFPAGFSQGGIIVFKGGNASGSVLSGTPVVNQSTVNGTAETSAGMTTADDRAMVLAFGGNEDVTGSHTSTFATRLQDASSGSLFGKIQAVAGATGSWTITSSGSVSWVTVAFALAPGTPVAQADVFLTQPDTAAGATPASAAAAWTAGAYVDVLPAGWDFDIALSGIEFEEPPAPALTTTYEALIEVATGAAGSETVIAQIPWTFRNVTAVGYFRQDPANLVSFAEPIEVAAGTRVAVRVRDSHTAALTYTGVKAEFREIAAASGAALTLNIDDTLTVADATAADVAHPVADTATVADATAADVAHPLADSLGVADATASAPSSAIADSLGVADSPTTQTGKGANIDDTLTVADATAADVAHPVADTATVADATTSAVATALADALGVADQAVTAVASILADALGVADSTTPQTGQAVAIDDTLGVADNVSTAGGKGANIDDTLTVADATTSAVATALADALGVTDARIAAVSAAVTDAAAVADTLTAGLAYALLVNDAAGVADQATPQAGKIASIDDTIGVADAIALAAGVGVNDALIVADARTLTIAALVADVLTVTDARGIDVAHPLADTIAVADQATPLVGRGAVIADTLAVADGLEAVLTLSAYRAHQPGHRGAPAGRLIVAVVGHRAADPGSASATTAGRRAGEGPGHVEVLP
jgi:hypothetical protein